MSRSQMTRRAGTVVTMIALLAGQAQAEPGKAKVRLTVQDRWTVQIERDLPTALAFHPQSAIVASGFATSRIRLWQTGRADPVRTIEVGGGERLGDVYSLDFDASGQRLVSNAGFMYAANRVTIWATDTGEALYSTSFDGYVPGIVSLADGDDLLVIGGECVQPPSKDPTAALAVRIWSPLADSKPRVLPEAVGEVAMPLALDPTRRFLATRGGDTQLRIWDVKTGKLLRKIELGDAGGIVGAFSSDGRQLVVREERSGLRVYDVQSGALIRKLKAEDERIGHIAVSSEANLIAAGDAKGRIILWDLRTGDRLEMLAAHTRAVSALVFSPNGHWLASAGADDAILLWRVEKE